MGTVTKNNITLVTVFESLTETDISMDKIRDLFSERTPQIMTLGNAVIVKFNTITLEIIITPQNNRLEIKLVNPSDDGFLMISEVAVKIRSAIKNSKVSAFGVNITSITKSEVNGDLRVSNLDTFFPNLDEINRLLEGNVFSISPQFNFTDSDHEYQVQLHPNTIDGNNLISHININIEDAKDYYSSEEIVNLLEIAELKINRLLLNLRE